MSLVRRLALVHLSTALIIGGVTKWMTARELKEDLRLWCLDDDEVTKQMIFRKYEKYGARDFKDLASKPSVQSRIANESMIRAAGRSLMWQLISRE